MQNKQKQVLILALIWVGVSNHGFSAESIKPISAGRLISFDDDWKFKKTNEDAKTLNYDDTQWRTLDVPHDWSIEDLPNSPTDSTIGPFYKKAVGKNATAFTVGGTAWYRKHFVLDKTTAHKMVYIQFDGVYMNSDVWINGHHLDNHPNGYTSFIYDMTAFLNPIGQPNIVAVQVKNEGDNSRWYSGSGIYRHVWLNIVNSTHIENWGVQIVSSNITELSADINIVTTINNNIQKAAPLSLSTEIFSSSGKLIASQNTTFGELLKFPERLKIGQTLVIKNPDLWSIETPILYKAKIMIKQKDKIIDEYTQSFGIRSIKFDAENGFALNGKTVKLRGGCIHHDNGPLGAVANDRAEERKIELLKKNGYNAIRLAHNAYSPQFLDACDRLGMLVLNESFDMWEKKKTPDDYSHYFKEWGIKDLESIVLRDRNHPSIIIWSIGNEIPEVIDSAGYRTAWMLANTIRNLDSTRAVTNAIPFFLAMAKGKKWDMTAPAFASLEVSGYNYAAFRFEQDHKKFPNRVMVTTEYFPPKALEDWNAVEKNNYVIGAFSWSAMDYLGEAGIGLARLKSTNEKLKGFVEDFMGPDWPVFNSYCGELDLIGNKKAASYYLDVVWRKSLVEMLVHRPIPVGKIEIKGFYEFPDELKCWTWPGHEKDSLQVRVFTRSPKVKLELNGKIIAEQTLEAGSIIATFTIPYTPGKLVAHCYEGDKEIASETLTTVGKPVAIRLKADRTLIKANKNDLAYISVEIVDESGNIVPSSDDVLIKYQISGNGIIIGVGNGNPRDMSSFQKPDKKVFQGRGLVIVRPNNKAGKINIKAVADNLKGDILTIDSN